MPPRFQAAGGLLLEVIIALTIMTVTLGVLSSELMMGLRLIQDGEKQTRAGELADRMLALLELDQQTQQRVFGDQQKEGDFGDEFPGYHWRIKMEPAEVVGLGQFTLEILHNEDEQQRADIRSARIVSSYSFLKADPGRIDLQKDFGIDLGLGSGDPGAPGAAPPAAEGGAPNPMAGLAQLLQTLGIDPQNLDPQLIASLPPEVLLALLPQLMPLVQQMMGGAMPGGGDGDFSLQDLLALQDQMQNGQTPAIPGAPGAGGQQPPGQTGTPGAPPAGGTGPSGEWTIEDLLEFQRQMEANGGGEQPAVGGPRPPGLSRVPGVDGDGSAGADDGNANEPSNVPRGPRGRSPAGRNPAQPPAGGNHGQPGGGSGPNGEWTIEDLQRLEQEMGGGQDGEQPNAPPVPPRNPGRGNAGRGGNRTGGNDAGVPKPPGGNRPPATPPTSPPAPGRTNTGGNPPIIEPSGVDENGNPAYTLEDLIRLRDELQRRGEGV